MSDDVSLVLAYIEASQRARASQRPEDFEAIRGFLADDIEIKLASPWTDAPWRVSLTSADQMVERLKAPVNKSFSLTTENTNVSQAGEDVLVEQLSTIVQEGARTSAWCATSSPSKTARSLSFAPIATRTASRPAELPPAQKRPLMPLSGARSCR